MNNILLITMISNPYINTILSTNVNLNPRQMDNKIYKYMKDNLIKKVEGKCFDKYGFVSKVYNIQSYKGGYIHAENPNAAATFSVKFSCKLCIPLKGKNIVCKIINIVNETYINSQNGPITVIVNMNNVNNELFFRDQRNNKLMYKEKNGSFSEINTGKYIVVSIQSKTFNNMDVIIMATGTLLRIASDSEIQKTFGEEYKNTENKTISYDDYIKEEQISIDNLDN